MEPLEDAFQQRLSAQMGTVFAACVADFPRKAVDFQRLLLGAFFHAVFGQAY